MKSTEATKKLIISHFYSAYGAQSLIASTQVAQIIEIVFDACVEEERKRTQVLVDALREISRESCTTEDTMDDRLRLENRVTKKAWHAIRAYEKETAG